ncbi:substrate-binding periplasmic protein [Undibacterium sp. TJN19]|uniref:substrate-binding periplasmic protein n=1 Tax=Undibacterium sp. TJN19 TaxID=3413055 RepID=UPI003BF09797
MRMTKSDRQHRRHRWSAMAALPALFLTLALLITNQGFAAEAIKTEKLVLLVRELRNDNGEVVPIRDEIRQLLAYFERELHVQFDIRRYPWTRLLVNARNGEGIVFGLSRTRERLTIFHFSEPIYANYVWLVTRSDATFTFNSMQDLKGKTVGIVRGTSYGDEFDANRNSLFQVEEDTGSHGARLKKLLNRRMDVMVFGDRRSQAEDVEHLLLQILRKDSSAAERTMDKTLETSFKVLTKPMSVDDLHFAAVSPQYDVWIKKLSQAIIAGKRSGEINRILIPEK